MIDPTDDWPTVAHEALTETRRIGARLLVVDTLPQFALPVKLQPDNSRIVVVPYAASQVARLETDLLWPSVVKEYYHRRRAIFPILQMLVSRV